MENFRIFRWETEKCRPGAGLNYKIRLSDYVLNGENGKPEASIFSFSYLKMPEDAGRPVVFAYNGGPGSNSGWLHMGLLGPKQVKIPGYPEVDRPARFELTDNREFLLDTCDLVLIDPTGTGWARLLEEKAGAEYYSTAGDARAVSRFITDWLEENGRTGVPVYLIGESYGTLRNLAVADVLPECVNLRGIVHIGTSFNVGARGAMYVEPNVRRLGANACTCWYHHHREECTREEFAAQAMELAYGDYAHALLMGNRLPKEERKSVLERLAYYTGLTPDFLDKHDLRFGEVDFLLNVVPGEVVSMYDSRLTHHLKQEEVYQTNAVGSVDIEEADPNQDAFTSCIGTAYDDALRAYIASELSAPEGRAWSDDMMKIAHRWNYRSFEKDTLALPAELMQRRNELRMLFVNGCYDLMSTFDFMTWYLSQYDLDPKRVDQLVLPSGHASYVDEGLADELNRNIRAFVRERSGALCI